MAPEGIGVDGKFDLFFPALQLQCDGNPVDVQVFILKIVGQTDAVSAAVGQKFSIVPCFCQNDVGHKLLSSILQIQNSDKPYLKLK